MKRLVRYCGCLLVAVVFAGSGCVSSARLDATRTELAAAYKDPDRPIKARVQAFDSLLDTFQSGTRESVIDRYIDYPPGTVKSRITDQKSDNCYSMHLVAPDGSDRWLTFKEDRIL